MTALLDGLRIIDLSQYIPGPFATLMLADLGADVVKVEPPAGDPMRGFAAGSGGVSDLYAHLNRGKRVVNLDLKAAEGRDAFERMVRRADVVLESFRPGVLDRLGLPVARLRDLNPALVVCSLSGFGQTGPYRDRAGHDLGYVALAGGLAASGTEDAPVMAFPPLADHASSLQAALSVLAALVRRGCDGRGCHIDLGIFEAAMAWQYVSFLAPGGAVARRRHILNGAAAYYNIYRTADGRFCTIGAIEKKFWAAFCTAVERPQWIERHGDPLPQDETIAEVAEVFAGRDLAAWQACLDGVDCCFEPVLDAAEVMAHPHVVARGTMKGAAPLFPARIDGAVPAAEAVPPREASAADVHASWEAAS